MSFIIGDKKLSIPEKSEEVTVSNAPLIEEDGVFTVSSSDIGDDCAIEDNVGKSTTVNNDAQYISPETTKRNTQKHRCRRALPFIFLTVTDGSTISSLNRFFSI